MHGDIRCKSCGFPIGKYREIYQQRVKKGDKSNKENLDILYMTKECCRSHFITDMDITTYFS